MTTARGALISMILAKVLTVTATVAAEKGSNALTLITADVDNISRSLL